MKSSKALILAVLAAIVVLLIVFLPRPPSSNNDEAHDEQALLDGPAITPVNMEGLHQLIKSRGAKLTIVNLWASFCEPCREEFPAFMRAYKEYRDQGLDLIFVSMDFKSDIQEARDFLTEQRVDFETFIKAERDEDFIKGIDPQWSGVIPTTLLFNEKGEKIDFIPRALTFEELEEKINTAFGSKK